MGLGTIPEASIWLVVPVEGLLGYGESSPVPPPGMRTVPANWTHVTLGPGPSPSPLNLAALPEVFNAAVVGVAVTGYSVRATLAPSPQLDTLRRAFAPESVQPSKPFYVTLAYAVRPVVRQTVAAWLERVERCLPPRIRLSQVEERRTGDLGPFEYAVLRRWSL